MKLNDRFPGRYLTKEDADTGLTACMDRVEEQQLKTPSGQTENRPVLLLRDQKPLVLNKSNFLTIADLYGADDESWSGHWICLFNDPSITFGGKRVGGVRIKPEKPAQEIAANRDSGGDADGPLPF